MKIYKIKIQGKPQYCLDYTLAKRRTRTHYKTRAEAKRAQDKIIKERKRLGDMFARYPESTRLEWVMAQEIADQMKVSVLEVVRDCGEQNRLRDENQITLGVAIRQFLKDKKDAVRPRSYRSLSSTVERFGESRWGEPLADVGRSQICDWLKEGRTRLGTPWASHTKNGYLTDLKNLFNWCVVEGHIDSPPTLNLKRFRATDAELEEREEAKQILTIEEVGQVLSYLRLYHPDMLPRAALLFFAGLRPDREAATITWDEILFDEDVIHVRASRAKDRQNRYIPMTANLRSWLEQGLSESEDTLPVANWDKRWYKMKKDLNLTGEEWPHDATRHSFASYHLALFGEEKTKDALGHGNYDMLFQHYRTLVRKTEAERYFSITCGQWE